jgi:hypothetical protein
MMELVVENGAFQIVTLNEDGSQDTQEINSPMLWCIHDQVCEKWKQYFDTVNQENNKDIDN